MNTYSTVQFGAFTTQQNERIAEARRQGTHEQIINPETANVIHDVLTKHLGDSVDISNLPKMNESFEQDLLSAIKERTGKRPYSQEQITAFRQELNELVKQLDEAPIQISGQVVNLLCRQYRNLF